MQKPQEKNDYYIKANYPHQVEELRESIAKKLTDTVYGEDLNRLIDAVYKAAYLDGFQDALFFKDS